MQPLIQMFDPCLIWFYRLTGHAGVDFVIGTFVLACISLLIGEVTLSLAFWLTRKRFGVKTAEAEKYQNLSMDALKAGNKEAYEAANKLAKDAFGHTFFQQVALSSAFLWPIFFALAWMQHRFLEVEFPIPGTDWSMGFIGVFIIIYVATYVLFRQVKRRISVFRLQQRNSVALQHEPVK
ncbi:MAG: hypothetical protein Q7O12_11535 [Deltaproteobacteria bacterium]|nr:hypothetical protein [Deltaproteobacteria bacterium]